MSSKKKTLADIIEEELKKFDAKPDLFADDPICEQAYDEAQNKANQQFNKDTKKKTIKGAEIINLLLFGTEPAPLLETIPRWRKYLRECITGWVHIGDLIILKGDVDDDFNNCVFRTNDLYYCIREMGILDEMRDENLVVDKKLEKSVEVTSEELSEEKEDGDCLEITFSRKGEHWEVGLNETAIFRDWVGMPYIEHVLQRPKQHISCISLGKQKNKQTYLNQSQRQLGLN